MAFICGWFTKGVLELDCFTTKKKLFSPILLPFLGWPNINYFLETLLLLSPWILCFNGLTSPALAADNFHLFLTTHLHAKISLSHHALLCPILLRHITRHCFMNLVACFGKCTRRSTPCFYDVYDVLLSTHTPRSFMIDKIVIPQKPVCDTAAPTLLQSFRDQICFLFHQNTKNVH